MVEQKHNMEPKTQEEVNVPETHKKPKHDSLLMSRRRFLKGAAGVGVTVMFGGFLGGCGDENKSSETPRQTSITQPTTTGENPTTSGTIPGTTESTEVEQTPTTKETTIKSYLLTIQEQSVFDLPTELSNKIIERVGDVDKITYLEARQNTDSDKKVSMWFVDSGEKHYVGFESEDGYKLSDYTTEYRVYTNRLDTEIIMNTRTGKNIFTFKLESGEFLKKDGETGIQYGDRILKIVENPEEHKGFLDSATEIVIKNPYKSNYEVRLKQEDEIKNLIEGLSFEARYIEGIKKLMEEISGNVEAPVSSDYILEGFPQEITIEDAQKNIEIPISKRITENINASEELRNKFRELTGGAELYYVGETNNGEEFNNVIHNKPLVFEGSEAKLYFDFFGGKEGPNIQEGPSAIGGIVVDATLIPNSEDTQGVKDIYLTLKDNQGKEFSVRLNIGAKYGSLTAIGVLNFKKDVQDPRVNGNTLQAFLIGKERPLIDFVRPGDYVGIVLLPDKDWQRAIKDENGTYEVRGLIVERGAGADEFEEFIFD